MKPSALRAILWAGLACGVLDILYVIVAYGLRGVSPVTILQSVAVGLLGRTAAYGGGWPTAALGLACHFLISFGAAGVYYLASRRLAVLVRRPFVAGPLFGVAVYLFMNLVVLPLSAVPPSPFPPANWMLILPAHLLCVGPPIALGIARLAPLSDSA